MEICCMPKRNLVGMSSRNGFAGLGEISAGWEGKGAASCAGARPNVDDCWKFAGTATGDLGRPRNLSRAAVNRFVVIGHLPRPRPSHGPSDAILRSPTRPARRDSAGGLVALAGRARAARLGH